MRAALPLLYHTVRLGPLRMLAAAKLPDAFSLRPTYNLHASAHKTSTLPSFQRTNLSSSAMRSDSFRLSFFFLPPRTSGCWRSTHLEKRNISFQARCDPQYLHLRSDSSPLCKLWQPLPVEFVLLWGWKLLKCPLNQGEHKVSLHNPQKLRFEASSQVFIRASSGFNSW